MINKSAQKCKRVPQERKRSMLTPDIKASLVDKRVKITEFFV